MKFRFLILVLLMTGLVCAGSLNENVLKSFDSGEEKVSVVLKMKVLSVKGMSFDGSYDSAPRYVVREVSLGELDSLVNDPSIDKIFPENHLHAFLQNSSGIINSTSSNNLQINSLNLTGTGQRVC